MSKIITGGAKPFLLKLNKILAKKCDPNIVNLHKEYEAKLGPDNAMVKGMATQVAEGGKAAVAEMIQLINETAESDEPMLPMTAEDFMNQSVELGMDNEELKTLRQQRLLQVLGGGSKSKDELGEALGIKGQALAGVLDPLVDSKQVVKVGDDYALPDTPEASA